jgi:hypothetical protein
LIHNFLHFNFDKTNIFKPVRSVLVNPIKKIIKTEDIAVTAVTPTILQNEGVKLQ